MKSLRYRLIFIALLLTSSSISAWASKEGMLSLSNFSLRSLGLDTSGGIEVSGTQSSDGITSLRINAFGRESALDSQLIAQLRNFQANGVQLSYEQGYKQLGGRTLYITFTKGFTSGPENLKVISINEKGIVRIYDKEPSKE